MKKTKIKLMVKGKVPDRSVYLCRGRVTLNHIGTMGYKERAKVCMWLRELAYDIRVNGNNYASNFTARYLI